MLHSDFIKVEENISIEFFSLLPQINQVQHPLLGLEVSLSYEIWVNLGRLAALFIDLEPCL